VEASTMSRSFSSSRSQTLTDNVSNVSEINFAATVHSPAWSFTPESRCEHNVQI